MKLPIHRMEIIRVDEQRNLINYKLPIFNTIRLVQVINIIISH